MARMNFCKDGLPFSVMITMECTNVGLNTLFKAATSSGMSYHVFVVYAYAVAALVLFPAPFISRRSRVLPPLNFSIVSKIALLGLIGSSSQIMGYTGISYSSPTLASAISNLVPAFTFILALIFRMEKVVLKSISSQAKILGAIVSISGAFVITLYKGPHINLFSLSPPSLSHQMLSSSGSSNWVIGGILLSGEYILVPLWYIVQTQIMKEYPAELTVVFFYNLSVSIIAAIVAAFTETDPNAWTLKPNIALASVLCSGLFGSCLNNVGHAWALKMKGPVFVAMFKPLSIAIAVAMGILFLGDALYLGSLIGASIISIGFYTVMWGKAKEEIEEDDNLVASVMESQSTIKSPLLESNKTEKK